MQKIHNPQNFLHSHVSTELILEKFICVVNYTYEYNYNSIFFERYK